MVRSEETGDMTISAQFPGQKESIKKMLKEDKKTTPLSNKPVPNPEDKTVKKVKTHVPNINMVEGRAPFSYSAIRKLLYQ